MPFFYDAESLMLAVAVGTSLRGLAVDDSHRIGRVIKHYPGHKTHINDVVISQHQLISASTEVVNHNLATGRERWVFVS